MQTGWSIGSRIAATAASLVFCSTTFSQPAPGYYDTADSSSPIALRDTLHEIIDDHTRFNYTDTSTDTWDVLEIGDEDQDNANNITAIYRNASYGKEGGGNSFYNREHTWPKSYGFPNDGSDNYPYTDMHHLFLADSGYNSSRSNKPYRYCTSGCSEKTTVVNDGRGGPGLSNFTAGSFTQGSWEVWEARRGDVARAMFYMDVRYAGGFHGITGAPEPDLILTDDEALIDASNTGSNISTAYMGILAVLLQWHDQDPVDLAEFQHHEAVASFQGNRNPFVDHPEWVDCVFRNTCSGGNPDTTPPAVPTGLAAVGTATTVDLDWFDNTEVDLAGYHVYRSEQPGGPYVGVNSGLVTSSVFSDDTVVIDVTYYYVVTAVDSSGNESADSFEASGTASSGGSGQTLAWINEFHYDNKGSDRDEFVEIAGTAGLSLSGWQILGYNGSNGSTYLTLTLAGVIPDQDVGFGTLSFAVSSLQNGSPDGLALVDDSGSVVQFLSYEGVMTATAGAAQGLSSIDIGIAENGSTKRGHSLYLTGTGASFSEFVWAAGVDSPGQVNSGQVFIGVDTTPPAAPGGLTASATATSIDLTWSANSEPDLAGYDVFRATTSGGPYVQLNGGLLTATSFGDTNAVVGTTYYYVITASDQTGNESPASAEATATISPPTGPAVAWINEFHYDNSGSDVGEFVEIAGSAGLDLTGWQLIGYNGNGGSTYKTINLSGVIPNQQNGHGTLPFDFSSMQNGAPDGLALVDDSGSVVEFLSYEGQMTATNGPASGLTSTNVGVAESSSTAIGSSLQKTGTGNQSADFAWSGPAADSYGQINSGQTLQ